MIRSVVLAAVLGVSIGAAACFSPTVPLPGPSAEIRPPDSRGMSVVTGACLEDAFVACLNESLESGVIVRCDEEGQYLLKITARTGDDVTLWQVRGSERGRFTSGVVP
jgi:hypothetical protein